MEKQNDTIVWIDTCIVCLKKKKTLNEYRNIHVKLGLEN